jgi:hypothetical protein
VGGRRSWTTRPGVVRSPKRSSRSRRLRCRPRARRQPTLASRLPARPARDRRSSCRERRRGSVRPRRCSMRARPPRRGHAGSARPADMGRSRPSSQRCSPGRPRRRACARFPRLQTLAEGVPSITPQISCVIAGATTHRMRGGSDEGANFVAWLTGLGALDYAEIRHAVSRGPRRCCASIGPCARKLGCGALRLRRNERHPGERRSLRTGSRVRCTGLESSLYLCMHVGGRRGISPGALPTRVRARLVDGLRDTGCRPNLVSTPAPSAASPPGPRPTAGGTDHSQDLSAR